MLTLFKRLFGELLFLMDHLKGPRYLRLERTNAHGLDRVRFFTDNGGVIDIYCIEHIYLLTYQNGWARDKRCLIYKVYGVCTADIPPRLRERFSEGLSIGPLLPRLIDTTRQKKAAIEGFISMVKSDLERDKTKVDPR